MRLGTLTFLGTARPLLGLVAAVLWIAAGTVASGQPMPRLRPQGKAQSIVITSNIKQAGIMRDGLFVGHSGNPFDAEPGVNTLIVSAQGHVPRIVQVTVSPTDVMVSKSVTLLALPNKNDDVDLDFDQAAKFPQPKSDARELPSLCQQYNDGGAPYSAGQLLTCSRKTLVDDLRFFGDKVLFQAPVGDQLAQALHARRYEAEPAQLYATTYDRYLRNPASEFDINLHAWAALLNRDCGRVMQIALETSAAGLSGTGLFLVRALCLETAGMTDKAVKIYQHLSQQEQSGCDIAYLAARGTWATGAKVAEEALAKCTRLAPSYYPAYEALAQVYALNRRPDLVKKAVSAWKRASVATVRTLLKSKPLNAKAVEQAWLGNRWNFELTVLMAAAGATPALTEKALESAEATLIADPALVRSLLPHIEARKDPRLTVIAYRLVADDRQTNPVFWIRFADAYRKLGRCSESVEVSARAQGLLPEGVRKDALIISDTTCLLALDRHTEAEQALERIIAKRPGQWKAHYNLGVVQERLGRITEALENFEVAMGSGEMPETTRSRLQKLVTHHRETMRAGAKKEEDP